VRNAKAVVPVCAALAESIEKYHPEKIVILWDCPFWTILFVDYVAVKGMNFFASSLFL
jgi:hypothetical protein